MPLAASVVDSIFTINEIPGIAGHWHRGRQVQVYRSGYQQPYDCLTVVLDDGSCLLILSLGRIPFGKRLQQGEYWGQAPIIL